ncbi:MAG: tetratricopeptide repeat protein [Campylobacterota bacterium]|nr:tetratricopeptide repeat protein [Campylobacterota bacterium]
MITKILQTLLLTLLLNLSLSAKESSDDEVDHLALATLMIYDAKYVKAHEELSMVDKKSPKYDGANFYTVVGVLASKEGKTQKAIEAYKKAIEATKTKEFKAPKSISKEKYLFSIGGEDEKVKTPIFDAEKKRQENISQLYMYLTQEYYKIKDYKNTVNSLENAGEKGRSRAGLYTLRAECYYKQGMHSETFLALNEGIKRFPEDHKLLKQKFYYFADLKLFQAAIEASKLYMEKVGASSTEYVTLAQMLIGANEIDSAIKLLEESKLKFPREAKIGILLGHMYLKKDMKNATAHLFEQSSYYDKQYLKDAVEMNRRAGNNLHALYLNTQNTDKVEKLKQKIAIYLNAGEYRKIIGLQKAMKRYKMLDDENLRYALAYSYYMSDDYESAEMHLKFISDSELFSKATVIRKNIEKCTNNPLECL